MTLHIRSGQEASATGENEERKSGFGNRADMGRSNGAPLRRETQGVGVTLRVPSG
jgi:hypothetical protein